MSHFHRTRGRALVPERLVPIALLSLACLASCGPSGDKTSQKSAKTTLDETRCESLLETALGGLKPERLGIDSERRATVDNLNQWAKDCAPPEETPYRIPADVLEMMRKVCGTQQMEHVDDAQFSGRDGLHVRDCFLMKRIADFATVNSKDSLNRVVDLFEYVNRNIDLEEQDPNLPPNTLYAAIFFGTGSAEDRAWVFASLLKQLRIDALILRPNKSPDNLDERAAARRWLVGVPLDGRVYLFDTRLGTPIPSPEDDGKSALVRKPATLSEVKEHDDLLRTLDLPDGRVYPLRSEDFSHLRVEVVGEISDWVPRMARLQKELAGEHSAVIYDPLEDRDGNEGALSRAVNAGDGLWETADVSIWPHPESATEGFESRSDEKGGNFQVKDLPFHSPFRFQVTETGLTAVPTSEHQRGRTQQLVGDYEGAIANYNNSLIEQNLDHIEQSGVYKVPEAHKFAHFVAADNATIWTAVSHLEENDPSAALNTLKKYKRRYQKTNVSGPWSDLCHALLAQILASRGDYAAALQELAEIPATAPERDGCDLLARRWQKLAGDAAGTTTAQIEPSRAPDQQRGDESSNEASSAVDEEGPVAAPKPRATQ